MLIFCQVLFFWTQTKIKYSLKQRVDSNAAFDMEQMQKSLDNTVNSQPRKSGGSSASNQQPRSKSHRADNGSSNLEVADQDSVQVMSNTTTPAKNGSNSSSSKPDKKVKYKSLWGKVGKHGLAEAAKEKAAADSSSSSSTGSVSRVVKLRHNRN